MREMKDSGVEWIGEVPESWGMLRINQLASPVKNKNVGMKESNLLSLSYGRIIPKDINKVDGLVPASYEGYNIIAPGDIVLRLTDLQNDQKSLRTGLCGQSGIITSAYLTIRPHHNLVIPEYLHYVLHFVDTLKVFYNMGDGMRQSLDWSGMNHMLLPIPLPSEQQLVVSYLDKRCGAIDDDVAKRREVIGKLKEYKKALIAHAVTKGLDSTAEMKDSGIGWAGRIPSSWSRCKLKSLFQIKKRIAGVDGLTVLSITQDGIKPKDFSTGKGQFAESYSHYQLVHPGDFAMNHMDLLTGWVDISRYEGVTSPDYRVFSIRNHETCHPRYFLYLFQMCYLNRIFFGSANGIADKGRMRLQTASFKDFLVPWPAFDEQARISSFLDERCAVIDEAIARQEQLIDKLGEYRKSIIHHAVTGKIDCTEG